MVTRVVRTLEQLRELGHEVLVFAPGKPPAEAAGHRVVRVPSVPFRPWYPELFLGMPRPRIGREKIAAVVMRAVQTDARGRDKTDAAALGDMTGQTAAGDAHAHPTLDQRELNCVFADF